VLLKHQDYTGLLGLDVKNWRLHRRPWDPSFKGAIWPLSGDRDSVTSSGCLYREGRVPEEAGAVSQACPPHGHSCLKCPSYPQW
jgi:hypothetical protein